MYSRKIGSGRPKALSKGDKIKIRKQINNNPYVSCHSIKRSLNIKAHEKTIYRYIKQSGYTLKKATKKPDLTEGHIRQRFNWEKTYKRKSWRRVIFRDETTFVLNQPQYGWTLPWHSLQQKSLTYNPKVKVWSSISSKERFFL